MPGCYENKPVALITPVDVFSYYPVHKTHCGNIPLQVKVQHFRPFFKVNIKIENDHSTLKCSVSMFYYHIYFCKIFFFHDRSKYLKIVHFTANARGFQISSSEYVSTQKAALHSSHIQNHIWRYMVFTGMKKYVIWGVNNSQSSRFRTNAVESKV